VVHHQQLKNEYYHLKQPLLLKHQLQNHFVLTFLGRIAPEKRIK